MQQIERYGVIALVFLLVTIVAVSFWGDSKSPGFWSRLTGRGAKKDAVAAQTAENPQVVAPSADSFAGSTGERALQTELPLNRDLGANTPSTPSASVAGAVAPGSNPALAPTPSPASGKTSAPLASSALAGGSGMAGLSSSALDPAPRPLAPAASSAGPARTASVSDRTSSSGEYVVQKGDNLMIIAGKTLGSRSRWTEIRDLNHGVEPRGLRVGMKLALPASASTARSSVPSKSEAPLRKPSTSPPSKSPASSTGTYVVRKGDTLKSIAERILGNSGRWKDIASANPGLDAHHIPVGTSIRVPSGKAEPLVAAAAVRESSSDRPHVR